MSQRRLRLMLLGGLGGAVILFFAIALGGLNLLSTQSQKLVELKQQNSAANAQASSLASSKKQVEQYAYFNTVAKTVLPSDKDQAQAVLDIFRLADQAGISIANITFPASNLGAKPSAKASSDAATASSKTAISQAKPVEGITGLYSLELIITPQTGIGVPEAKKVSYQKFLDFLDRIERNRRTAQITQVNIQPETSASGPSQFIDFTLTINIFMKP